MRPETAGPAAGDGGPERAGTMVETLTPVEYHDFDALSLRQAAELYATLGFRVFPCAHRAKEPAVKGGVHAATNDVEQVRRIWGERPGANIGLALDGLVLVDLDPRNEGPSREELWERTGGWPQTAEAVSGSGGRHIFFRARPGWKPRASLGKGIDCKSGAGSYALVAPSVHPSGGVYRWDGADPVSDLRNIADAPEWVYEGGRREQPKPEQQASSGPADHAAIEKAADVLAAAWPEPGSRNRCFLALSGALARAGIPQETAEELARRIYRKLWPSDPDYAQAVREVAASYEKFGSGEETTGYSTLRELVGEAAASEAMRALGVEQRLHVDLNASTDAAVLEQWLADPAFAAIWRRQRADLDQRGQEAYDEALAEFGVRAGLGDQQIIDLIVHHRRIHAQRPRTKLPYFERLIDQARPRERRHETPPGATDEEKRRHLLADISSRLGFEVAEIRKILGKEPTYHLVTAAGNTLEFSSVSKLIEQRGFRTVVAAGLDRIIPKFKGHEWEALAQMMLDALVTVDAGEEMHQTGSAGVYLDQYLSETSFVRLDDDEAELPAHLRRKPAVIDGVITLCLTDFQQFLARSCGVNMSVRELAASLVAIGAVSKRFKVRRGLLRDQYRWLLPADEFPPARYWAGLEPAQRDEDEEEEQ